MTINRNIKARTKLKKILREKGWTQKRLSEITGINEGTISKFDFQESHNGTHLFLIKEALGLKSIEDLYEIEEIKKEEG